MESGNAGGMLIISGKAFRINIILERSKEEMMQEAINTQRDDLAILTRLNKQLSSTKDIGQTTLTKMQNNREQINNITRGVDNVDSNLKEADRHLRTFSRRT